MEDDSHLIDSRIYVHIYYIDISYSFKYYS